MQQDNKPVGEKEDKKVYGSPVLVEYGSISKLTQGGTSTVPDGPGLQMCL